MVAKCGITNLLDGSEDDFVFDSLDEESATVVDDSLMQHNYLANVTESCKQADLLCRVAMIFIL